MQCTSSLGRPLDTLGSGLFLLVAFIAVASAATKWHQLHKYSFEDYEREFAKQYAHKAERQLRQEVFERNLAQIRAHNSST